MQSQNKALGKGRYLHSAVSQKGMCKGQWSPLPHGKGRKDREEAALAIMGDSRAEPMQHVCHFKAEGKVSAEY